MKAYEKLGVFYLGRDHDLETGETSDEPLLYDSKDLVTHAVCVGMTGSGKTGLCVGLLEEAALDGIPAIVIDPKGDLGNLMLTFPDLLPEDFRPWINEDDASRKGMTPDEFAATQSELWTNGLQAWDQNGDRIRRLREAAEFTIYTPGSEAGRPVSIMASFAAPSDAVLQDNDLLQERISTTTSSLLGLLNIDADPIQSREHILIANLLDHLWKSGARVDLGVLIQAIQNPPLSRIGVLDLESFYSSKDRFALAMKINHLLAAPSFRSWMSGDPLDVGQMLYTPAGKPRIAIFSIAHLPDAERMFFVSLLLNQTLSWMRSRPGTTSLRALLYMDEIFGFMPPVSEPPSKKPLLTLLKQARAHGLGVVLATQNPVDLDYKGLSNTGTWFIGRLQTERDKKRVLDGLDGISMGGKELDRKYLSRVLSRLGKRVFLLHNVHEDGPVVFHTRWVMSYLRGPLTRSQITGLTAATKLEDSTDRGERRLELPTSKTNLSSEAGRGTAPVIDPAIPQVFAPIREVETGEVQYVASVLGIGRVQFIDSKTRKPLFEEEVALLADPGADGGSGGKVDWQVADELDISEADLTGEPPGLAVWGELPAAAGKAKSYAKWQGAFSNHLYRSRTLDLYQSPSTAAISLPGESERDFRLRLADVSRELRDLQTEKLRRSYAVKVERLEERVRKAKQALEKEKEQASGQKLQAAISAGAVLLSVFTGRKKLSYTTLSRAKTALRGVGTSARDAGDVKRAFETIESLTEQLEELNGELQSEIDSLAARFDSKTEELKVTSIRPRRSDVEVRLVALAWMPYSRGRRGVSRPLWV